LHVVGFYTHLVELKRDEGEEYRYHRSRFIPT